MTNNQIKSLTDSLVQEREMSTSQQLSVIKSEFLRTLQEDLTMKRATSEKLFKQRVETQKQEEQHYYQQCLREKEQHHLEQKTYAKTRMNQMIQGQKEKQLKLLEEKQRKIQEDKLEAQKNDNNMDEFHKSCRTKFIQKKINHNDEIKAKLIKSEQDHSYQRELAKKQILEDIKQKSTYSQNQQLKFSHSVLLDLKK